MYEENLQSLKQFDKRADFLFEFFFFNFEFTLSSKMNEHQNTQFLLFLSTFENGEELCTLVFFFILFSTQNQVPKTIVGPCWVIRHIEALSVVI